MGLVYVHSETRVSETDAYRVFRAACEGGGDPPEWTTQGDDPAKWAPPPDAAGGLWTKVSGVAMPCGVAHAVGMLGHLRHYALAAYFSSGGQAVILMGPWDPEEPGGIAQCWIWVARPEDQPRIGVREQDMARAGAAPELVGPGWLAGEVEYC